MTDRKVVYRYNYFLKREFKEASNAAAVWEVKLDVPFTVDEMRVRTVMNYASRDIDLYGASLVMSGVGELCTISNITHLDVNTVFKIKQRMESHYTFSIKNYEGGLMKDTDLNSFLSVHLEFLVYPPADSF